MILLGKDSVTRLNTDNVTNKIMLMFISMSSLLLLIRAVIILAKDQKIKLSP
jgi:hypothetical protein